LGFHFSLGFTVRGEWQRFVWGREGSELGVLLLFRAEGGVVELCVLQLAKLKAFGLSGALSFFKMLACSVQKFQLLLRLRFEFGVVD
jgi:hypothetical protein